MSPKSSIWAALLLGGQTATATTQPVLKDVCKRFFRVGAARLVADQSEARRPVT